MSCKIDPVRSNPTGRILQDESYRTNPTGQILQDESYRTNPTGRILQVESYRNLMSIYSKGVASTVNIK